jgi:hypothetical protein
VSQEGLFCELVTHAMYTDLSTMHCVSVQAPVSEAHCRVKQAVQRSILR